MLGSARIAPKDLGLKGGNIDGIEIMQVLFIDDSQNAGYGPLKEVCTVRPTCYGIRPLLKVVSTSGLGVPVSDRYSWKSAKYS